MIILISGPINAGKTTVARLLAAQLPNAAHVEVDDLTNFLPALALDDMIPVGLEMAAAVIAVLARRGFAVVVSFPLRPEDYDYLCDALREHGPLRCFTLAPAQHIAAASRGARTLTDWERERSAAMYAEGYDRPPFGAVIDSSAQSADETAAAILAQLPS